MDPFSFIFVYLFLTLTIFFVFGFWFWFVGLVFFWGEGCCFGLVFCCLVFCFFFFFKGTYKIILSKRNVCAGAGLGSEKVFVTAISASAAHWEVILLYKISFPCSNIWTSYHTFLLIQEQTTASKVQVEMLHFVLTAQKFAVKQQIPFLLYFRCIHCQNSSTWWVCSPQHLRHHPCHTLPSSQVFQQRRTASSVPTINRSLMASNFFETLMDIVIWMEDI